MYLCHNAVAWLDFFGGDCLQLR